MDFKTPKFWEERNGLSTFLVPASILYGMGYSIHQKFGKRYKAEIPVICVGNAVMGGGGKTPTVIALLELTKDFDLAKNPYVLTRGYGGKIDTPIIVDPKVHTIEDVGDEPLLISKYAPVVKSPDRAAGAKLARKSGADLIIMDDGLHNPALYKDATILVMDSNYGCGNERLFPAGPLRGPLKRTMNIADIIITIGKRNDGYSSFSLNDDLPSLWAYLDTDYKLQPEQSYVAFAGIGLPHKFKRSLEQAGADVLDFHEFADHHVYTTAELETLKKQAMSKKARLITTEKDFMRIPLAYHKYIDTFPVHLIFEEPEALANALSQKINDQS